jgi:hemerythrin-like metal-binding protein
MGGFKWSESHSVHLPEVDAEHRSLFRLAGELKNAHAAGAPRKVVAQKLRALLAESEDHFTHEERMMRQARYMMFAWHKSQHDALRKRAKTASGDPAEFLAFLERWLPDHMAVADNMMGATLRNYHRSHAA